MPKIIFKIALPIILTGFFVAIVFIALYYNNLDANFYIILVLIAVYIFSFGFAVGVRVQKEFDNLEKGLSSMTAELEEQKTALQATERGVDIKVKARTDSLEETITALEQKIKNRTLEMDKLAKECEFLRQQIKNQKNA